MAIMQQLRSRRTLPSDSADRILLKTQRRPSFIIFDLGNVLVHIDPLSFLRSLSIDSAENRRYYQPLIVDIVKRYERGDESTEEFLANLDILFNSDSSRHKHDHGGKAMFSRSEFQAAMLSIIGDPVIGMEEVVRRMSASTPLGLLSNTNPLHFAYCLERFPVLRYIPTHFLSYQLRAFKPETEIFNRVAARLPFSPETVLYIDDLPDNVHAGEAVGFQTCLFVGVEKLMQLFHELGLA